MANLSVYKRSNFMIDVSSDIIICCNMVAYLSSMANGCFGKHAKQNSGYKYIGRHLATKKNQLTTWDAEISFSWTALECMRVD